MRLSTFNIENELLQQGYDFIIGVDEAGRGPLAGPVVACAVVLKNSQTTPAFGHPSFSKEGMGEVWNLVRDSKKLSEKQREKVYDFVLENFHVGIGMCDHETIDQINILEASFLAMKKAVQNLKQNIRKDKVISRHPERGDPLRQVEDEARGSRTNADSNNLSGFFVNAQNDGKIIILVDGNKPIPNFSMRQKAIINGDAKIKSISAASIIAKVTRDRLMREMHEKYPHYGFDKHKGYGTKMHMEAIFKHGPCEIHRKSFAPFKKEKH